MKEKESLRFNEGKTQWSFVDFESLAPLADVLVYGGHKYSIFEDKDGKQWTGEEVTVEESKDMTLISSGRDNWKIGFPALKLLESLARHLFCLMKGEKYDKQSGLPHIGHLMANAMFYSYHYNKKE